MTTEKLRTRRALLYVEILADGKYDVVIINIRGKSRRRSGLTERQLVNLIKQMNE